MTRHPNYDRDSRLTGLVATGPSATEVSAVSYRYDAAGNRTRKSTSALVEDYGYDKLDRLEGVQRAGVSTDALRFGYDRVGNRTSTQRIESSLPR